MKARMALLACLLLPCGCAGFLVGHLASGDSNAFVPGMREPVHSGNPPRVSCFDPPALRLVRYEDGSARLLCGEAILVSVSVPG
jgi:hypothetical protein